MEIFVFCGSIYSGPKVSKNLKQLCKNTYLFHFNELTVFLPVLTGNYRLLETRFNVFDEIIRGESEIVSDLKKNQNCNLI